MIKLFLVLILMPPIHCAYGLRRPVMKLIWANLIKAITLPQLKIKTIQRTSLESYTPMIPPIPGVNYACDKSTF
ncbi:phosphorylase domain protein [Yersinia pseudotuberculosis]|nr:phosphorylase domain protein [Yersinia pseudotuberculosis]